MKELTLTFLFQDDGTMVITGESAANLSILEDVKMVSAFLTLNDALAGVYVTMEGVQSYMEGMARVHELRELPNKGGHRGHNQSRGHDAQRP